MESDYLLVCVFNLINIMGGGNKKKGVSLLENIKSLSSGSEC